MTTYANAASPANLDDEELTLVVDEMKAYQQLRRNFPTDAEKVAWLASPESLNIEEGVNWFPAIDITTL